MTIGQNEDLILSIEMEAELKTSLSYSTSTTTPVCILYSFVLSASSLILRSFYQPLLNFFLALYYLSHVILSTYPVNNAEVSWSLPSSSL